MIENGVLDGVDHVLGVHVMSTMKTGKSVLQTWLCSNRTRILQIESSR